MSKKFCIFAVPESEEDRTVTLMLDQGLPAEPEDEVKSSFSESQLPITRGAQITGEGGIGSTGLLTVTSFTLLPIAADGQVAQSAALASVHLAFSLSVVNEMRLPTLILTSI